MMPETARLLQKARDSRQAAALLAGANFREFAAARAYYAMFYAAQALLLERGLSSAVTLQLLPLLAASLPKPGCSIRGCIATCSMLRTCGTSATTALKVP